MFSRFRVYLRMYSKFNVPFVTCRQVLDITFGRAEEDDNGKFHDGESRRGNCGSDRLYGGTGKRLFLWFESDAGD